MKKQYQKIVGIVQFSGCQYYGSEGSEEKIILNSILKCLVSIIIFKNGSTVFKIQRANLGGGGGGLVQVGQNPTFQFF